MLGPQRGGGRRCTGGCGGRGRGDAEAERADRVGGQPDGGGAERQPDRGACGFAAGLAGDRVGGRPPGGPGRIGPRIEVDGCALDP